ncbi:hypothetical protein NL676_016516 [Syzygium grande]|nr:hypothetical protein NL676_016516 [Syzygium grande]
MCLSGLWTLRMELCTRFARAMCSVRKASDSALRPSKLRTRRASPTPGHVPTVCLGWLIVGGHEELIPEQVSTSFGLVLIYLLDKDGESPLLIAAFQGLVNVVDELVRFCPDAWDIINNIGETALHAAVIGGRVGYKAARVEYVLKGKFGVPCMQDWVMDDMKKRLDRCLVEGQSAMSTTTGSNTPDRENFDLSKRSFIDFHLLAAVLIASVSFAAAFTMPGGYSNGRPD